MRGNGLDREAVIRPFYTRAGPTLLALEPADPPPEERGKKQEDWLVLYQHLESRLAAFLTWRLSWWQNWAEIARYELPYRYHAFITANTYDRGLRRDNLIIDETATLAGKVCAAGMMAGLTDPDRPWLKLGPAMPGIELDRAGQVWFDDLTDRLRYLQAESNFYDSLAVAYEDLTFFGNGVTIDYEHDEDVLHTVNYCAGEYFLGAGFDFSDEVLYAEFRLTLGQIVERYGLENCPEEIRRGWAQKGSALEGEYVIGHAIEPNFAVKGAMGREAGVVPGGFTWREVFWLRGKSGNGPLSVAGFREKPFAVMRWDQVSNDPYARGPGSMALGGTIELQLKTRAEAEAMEKVNRPPMVGPPSLMNAPSNTRPDGITYVSTVEGKSQFYPAYEIRPDIPAITASRKETQERIERIFYNPLFRAIEMLRNQVHGQVTATEIDALKAEQLTQLGPVLGRVLNEGIRPRIRRQLAIMHRAGLVPRMPDSVRRAGLKIEFISMLTMAQRAAATAAIQRAWAFAQEIAPLAPTSAMTLDENESVREMAELLGVPARLIRAPQDVKQRVAAFQAHQQQIAAGQAAMAGVEGAKTLSQADIGGGQNALQGLLQTA